MMVMSILACTHEEAQKYLDEAGGDTMKAIDMQLCVPITPGNKYIPETRKIDDGLDTQVREKLTQARQLSELFNASFRNDLLVTKNTAAQVEGQVEGQVGGQIEGQVEGQVEGRAQSEAHVSSQTS